MKDLVNSPLERANILNNKPALKEIYEQVGFRGVMHEGKYRYTKPQVAEWFEIDERTVERILEHNQPEMAQSGYRVFSGQELQKLKTAFASDIHVARKSNHESDLENYGFSPKTRNLGVFTFKSVLNLGMLLVNSNPARELRAFILDVVIDLLNQRLGGSTKYINQRDQEFLPSIIREKHYREAFTNAIDHYIEKSKFKYARLTDVVYLSIFKENAKEYRQVLNLHFSESVRETLYSEVLDLVSSYENGFADFLRKYSEEMERPLSLEEALSVFRQFESMTDGLYQPLREKARSLMASRDMAFRDALHEKLRNYIGPVSEVDYERFLGEKSRSLEQRLEENQDVFKRLKER
jgi:hypothetical protein